VNVGGYSSLGRHAGGLCSPLEPRSATKGHRRVVVALRPGVVSGYRYYHPLTLAVWIRKANNDNYISIES
jgi:hypothetical protein